MNKIKSSLKNKDGMALPGVLVIFAVLCVFAAAMYILAMSSLREVRYLSERKKAEYLAQAGVEAAAYAYQTAVNNRGNNADYDNFVEDSSNDENSVITMKKVYMVWFDDTRSYGFLKEDEVDAFVSAHGKEDVIGSYEAELTNSVQTYDEFTIQKYDSDSGTTTQTSDVVELKADIKVIKATGYSYNSNTVQKKTAYIPNPKQAYGSFYGDDGIIDMNSADLTTVGEYTFPSKLTLKTNHFGSFSINTTQRTVPLKLAYSAGNMIIGKPQGKNVDDITLPENKDNMIVFAGMNDLFVQAGIDTNPSNTRFNYVFLRGNNIVINGNIELYAYGFTRNTNLNLTSNLGTLADIIRGRYRFSTVIIGTPSKAGTTVNDPVRSDSKYNFGDCGRIYFGGDVFINIQFPNVGTYRYKAFSSGDVYYFNDDLHRSTDPNDQTPYGIDLFKYFLDRSIATKAYSDNVLNRFQDLIDTYYDVNGKANTTVYVQGDGNGNIVKDSMRKIDVNKYKDDTYSSIIPPDPVGAEPIIWDNVG